MNPTLTPTLTPDDAGLFDGTAVIIALVLLAVFLFNAARSHRYQKRRRMESRRRAMMQEACRNQQLRDVQRFDRLFDSGTQLRIIRTLNDQHRADQYTYGKELP